MDPDNVGESLLAEALALPVPAKVPSERALKVAFHD